MFVLPPQPRFNGTLYPGMPGGGPPLETSNTLQHPTGPEYQLAVGEGTYTLKDDLYLATPPPHPSDAPQPNNNPLATTVAPSTVGSRLSIVVLAPRNPPTSNVFRAPTAPSGRSNLPRSIQEEAQSPRSETGSTSNGFGTASYYTRTPGFGDGNPALAAALPAAKGKKDQKLKPKSNIVKSNSSFVSRVIPHEHIQKRLNERSPDGVLAFVNVNRSFLWLDLSSDLKAENLTKVLLTKAHPLCHDVNSFTKSSTHLDLVLGFNTSDIIWYEPISQKYARLNKNGAINPSPVSSILWLPNKENLFLAAHRDGSLVVYDKDKEDAVFAPEEASPFENGDGSANGFGRHKFEIKKSAQSPNQKANPVAVWQASSTKINDMAFSPDGQLLAVVSEDGSLSIFDYIRERVLDVFRSYYGGLLCVTWSPDGKYVLTGGQDDLVSIWSLADRALVARCVGHQSWITDVKFDAWRCDERNYRFGSVGEDCRLLLWDFSVNMLGRTKAMSLRPRGSMASHLPPDRALSISTTGRFRSGSNLSQEGDGEAGADDVVHPVEPKASTANLPPVMSKIIDDHPLSWLGFEEHCILTACREGHVREWARPADGA